MSKKKSSESSSITGSAQAWAQPIAQAGASSVQGVFNQNQPGLQQLTDLTHNDLVNPLLGKFQSSMGPANQASGYYSDVLNGKYLNGNPYISNILQQLDRGVGDQVNSQFEQSGRYGSGAHADVLSRNLADANSNVLYQNYGDEMNRMGQAAQGAQAGNISDIQALMAAITGNAQLPYVGSSNMANSLGALFNGGTQKSTSWMPNPIFGAIGSAMSSAGQAAAAGG